MASMAPARSSSRGEGHSGSGNEIWRGRGVSETANEKQKDGRILVLGAETFMAFFKPILIKEYRYFIFQGGPAKECFSIGFHSLCHSIESQQKFNN